MELTLQQGNINYAPLAPRRHWGRAKRTMTPVQTKIPIKCFPCFPELAVLWWAILPLFNRSPRPLTGNIAYRHCIMRPLCGTFQLICYRARIYIGVVWLIISFQHGASWSCFLFGRNSYTQCLLFFCYYYPLLCLLSCSISCGWQESIYRISICHSD